MKIAVRLALVLCAFALATPRAAGQLLENEFFRVKATATGFSYDARADKQKKVKLKVVNYVRFVVPAEGFGTYALEVWSEVAPGEWAPSPLLGEATAADPNEEVLYDGVVTLLPEGSTIPLEGDGPFVDVFFTAKTNIKQKDGQVTKAKIKQIGATTFGSHDGVNVFDGTAKFTMTRVPTSKLPFVPTM